MSDGGLIAMLRATVNATVPPYDADPRVVNLHRWRVTLVACSAWFGMIGIYLISMGWAPFLSSGFATKQDVGELRQTILDERASTLDQQLFSLRVLNCKSKSDEEKTLYLGRIRDLMQRYYDVTGRMYNLPDCTDF